MAHEYTWQQARSEPTYRADNHDHLGWWAAAAMLVSILLHVIVFFALDQVKFALGISKPVDAPIRTEYMPLQQESIPQDFVAPPPPEDAVPVPPQDTAKLLEDIDLLPLLKDQELEMRPDVDKPEIGLATGNPAQEGDPRSAATDVSASFDTTKLDLPEFGRQEYEMKPAAIGQVTIDPGAAKADPLNLDKFTEDLVKQGAGGKAEKGSLDGLASLDDLLGLPPNELLGKTTMLPSDLLFAFNKYDVRESAKIGLAKLGMVLDKNPKMYCWIEGHTDLIGNDVANLELSIKRAEAVKRYLVESMYFDPDKIITRGYGRYQPIVTTGDKDQQSANRRVEIKIRNTPPSGGQIAPPKAAPVQEEMPPPTPRPAPAPTPAPMPVQADPPKAVLVKGRPPRAVQVIEEAPPAPRAKPIPQMPEIPPARAIPVQEDEPGVLKAQPVAE